MTDKQKRITKTLALITFIILNLVKTIRRRGGDEADFLVKAFSVLVADLCITLDIAAEDFRNALNKEIGSYNKFIKPRQNREKEAEGAEDFNSILKKLGIERPE